MYMTFSDKRPFGSAGSLLVGLSSIDQRLSVYCDSRIHLNFGNVNLSGCLPATSIECIIITIIIERPRDFVSYLFFFLALQ